MPGQESQFFILFVVFFPGPDLLFFCAGPGKDKREKNCDNASRDIFHMLGTFYVSCSFFYWKMCPASQR